MSEFLMTSYNFDGLNLYFPDHICLSSDTFDRDESATYKVLSLLEPDNVVLCFNMNNIVDSVLDEDRFAEYVSNNFDLVLTYKDRLLKKIPNSRRLNTFGSFLDLEVLDLNHKENKISMFMSNKSFTVGHQLRHTVWNHMSGRPQINEFSYDQLMTPPRVSKNVMFDKYKYSIIIENEKSDFYLTEKIVDCFLAKAIPIYWGCPSIGEFFNADGILQFDSLEELDSILYNLKDGYYESKIDAIEDNYIRAKNFPSYQTALEKVLNEYFYGR